MKICFPSVSSVFDAFLSAIIFELGASHGQFKRANSRKAP